MKQEVKIGQQDYTVLILIRDTAGAAKTGLTNASAGIDVGYSRVETDNDVTWTDGAVVALATPALTDVHLDWGFLEVDAAKAPGIYRLDIADGVFASGAWSAVVSLVCTGCDPVHLEFVLVSFDPRDSVRLGLTALPNAAADAAGGLPISDAGGLDLDTKLANTNEVTAARMGALTDWIDGGRLDLILDGILTDTAVIGAAGAGLTAIPWNAAWDAEVQSEVTDALNAYDPPTNAEMEARTLPAASYFDPAADTVAHVTLVDTTTTNTDLVTAAAVKAAVEAAGSSLALIKAKTDSLTFTVAGYLNSNVYVINGTTLQGDGSLANPWKPL